MSAKNFAVAAGLGTAAACVIAAGSHDARADAREATWPACAGHEAAR